MDSVYASPDDFKRMNRKDMIRGLHLLEYFVNRCHELGVAFRPTYVGNFNCNVMFAIWFSIIAVESCRFLAKHGLRKVILRK